jgi:hypothetical protein
MFFHDQEAKAGNIKRIRAGEVAATAIVVGTGWAVSVRSTGNVALWASIAISVIFVTGYEYQIRNPSKQDTGTPAKAAPGLVWPKLGMS